MNDDILLQVIENSGYNKWKEFNLDDLSSERRAIVVLVDELFSLRPELKEIESDVVYIVKTISENGNVSFSLPSKSLKTILDTFMPYDDSSIWTYSIKNSHLLKRMYRGTGTKWEKV